MKTCRFCKKTYCARILIVGGHQWSVVGHRRSAIGGRPSAIASRDPVMLTLPYLHTLLAYLTYLTYWCQNSVLVSSRSAKETRLGAARGWTARGERLEAAIGGRWSAIGGRPSAIASRNPVMLTLPYLHTLLTLLTLLTGAKTVFWSQIGPLKKRDWERREVGLQEARG